jgi:hypothetical protein
MIDWPLAELLPHAGDMILIEQIGASMKSRSTPAPRCARRPVQPPDGSLPAWVGIELMAQSVAAFAGCRARAACRWRWVSARHAQVRMQRRALSGRHRTDHPRAALAGRRQRHGRVRMPPSRPGIHATARLNVYRPPQPEYLAEAGPEEQP